MVVHLKHGFALCSAAAAGGAAVFAAVAYDQRRSGCALWAAVAVTNVITALSLATA